MEQPAVLATKPFSFSVNGSIFVSVNANSQIHVFDVERKHVKTFGQNGKGEEQLNVPL